MKTNRNILLSLALMGAATFGVAKDYKGGELFSHETFHYGKFEARMLMTAGSGVVSSMFLYYNDSYMGAPEPWREVDIEVLGKDPYQFQSNIITGNAARRVTTEGHHAIPNGAHLTYHTYGMEWTPDYLAWTVDGVEVRRVTGQAITDLQDKEQNLRFNLWAANIVSWVGAWDEAILPVHQYINWVQVSAYTPGAGPGGSDFTLSWREDFNDWDGGRWGVANWTFAENRADLAPENVEIKDGILVLSLTKAPQYGHQGAVPADGGSVRSLSPLSGRPGLSLQRQGDGVRVSAPFASSTALEVRNLQGTVLRRSSARGVVDVAQTEWNISLAGLPEGVLILHLPGVGSQVLTR